MEAAVRARRWMMKRIIAYFSAAALLGVLFVLALSVLALIRV
jgi:hypothetical protein